MSERPHPTAGETTRRRIALVVAGFELTIYGIAFLLLVASAVLIVVGGIDTIAKSLTPQPNTFDSGVLVLDRVLLVLIIAELAYTFRNVLRDREITAEPFLVIGLIATVRRILIVTAAFDQSPSENALNRLLFELGALGLLVLAIAAAIFLVRFSARHRNPQP